MPGWNLHLEAGERLANDLKLTPKKRKEFLLGCILPDINNSYINHAKTVKPHHETHYAFEEKSSLNFYTENQAKIESLEPIFIGYLFHLFTDGFFNYNFFYNIKHNGKYQNLSFDEKSEIKRHDFFIYGSKFHHFIGIRNLAEAEKLARLSNRIRIVNVTASDLFEIEEILKGSSLLVDYESYFHYSEPILEELLSDMMKNFKQQYPQLFGGKNA